MFRFLQRPSAQAPQVALAGLWSVRQFDNGVSSLPAANSRFIAAAGANSFIV
jgi:hypothetical protein